MTDSEARGRPVGMNSTILLGEVAGGETYQTLLPRSFDVEAFGIRFKCIDFF
jgi:hypothetical protein